jgi:hypothetical protein
MTQLILSAAGTVAGAAGRAGVGTLLSRSLAATAASYAAGAAERLLFGPRKRTVEGPRLDAFPLQSSTEGAPIARVFGRARIAGQLIWAANFKETLSETTETSGKGGRLAASKTTVREYLYSLSFAVGLCEGPIDRVARVFADGKPFDLAKYNVRIHRGGDDQTPDDVIAAIEGAAPAYRGMAYAVFEDLPLKEFGNRIPQLHFEIERAFAADDPAALENALSAATIIPGSGEFVYATTRIAREDGEGGSVVENAHNSDGVSDFSASLDALAAAAPNLEAAALVVAWFGTDLRAGACELRPGVETDDKTTFPEDWRGGGVSRGEARRVSLVDGRPAYGGTPNDRGVVEAIGAMKAKGLAVMFHPFILMDIPPGNLLPHPNGGLGQPAFPWRGRIAAAEATAAADIQRFFGTARPQDFSIVDGAVHYAGPPEWSFRRMILHDAHLCALAGGVESFLLGSELKSLLAARDSAGGFPAVAAMRALAADVRAVLGAATKLSYGADWSEWSGVTAADGRFFHLDPLWADAAIDFIGVDYYPPLADWRDGWDHADARAGWRADDRAYIAANIEGGEHFDWHYASDADRAAQRRTPIADAAGEPWIWRAKDIRGWWENAHHDRPGFVRAPTATAWIPRSKPIRFTELGAPAVDKGANAPNVFVDPKSSESALPPFSTGARDDLAQRRALEAVHAYWRDPARNPLSPLYGGRMVETDRLYVYAWDARPYPFFPGRADLWGDAANWRTGHWLNGRLLRAPLSALVEALAAEAGVAVDAAALGGAIAGYVLDRPMSPRQAIDPLADIFQFDMVEGETLRFQPRGAPPVATLSENDLVDDGEAPFALTLGQSADLPNAVRLLYLDEGADERPAVAEARLPYAAALREIAVELPAVMDEGAAAARARALLADAALLRETARFALPPSYAALEPGDSVTLDVPGAARRWRILSIADRGARRIEAARISPSLSQPATPPSPMRPPAAPPAFGRPAFELMNLPLLADGDDPTAPYLAVFADPWPGAVALYRAAGEWAHAATATGRAVLGRLTAPLPPGAAGRFDERTARLRLRWGALAARSAEELFAGANAAAVETAAGWEVLQFRDAALLADGSWALKGLLRGQGGTERAAAAGAAQGARFVLLTGAVVQAALPFDLRGLSFDWRAGPADDHPTEATFRTRRFAGEARGLVPLSPVHLRASEGPQGIALSWIRRTRIGGDSWAGEDVPLGEAFERYRIEIRDGGRLVRSAEAAAPAFLYSAAMIAADFPAGRPPLSIRVAQLSDAVGPGDGGAVDVR